MSRRGGRRGASRRSQDGGFDRRGRTHLTTLVARDGDKLIHLVSITDCNEFMESNSHLIPEKTIGDQVLRVHGVLAHVALAVLLLDPFLCAFVAEGCCTARKHHLA